MQTTSETTPASRSRRLRRLWISAVTVLAVGICFGPALSSGTLITHPESILRLPLLSRAGHLPRVFSRHFMSFTDGEYRPLSYAMIGVMRSWVSADNATFWHLWLLGFHVLNAWLVYAIARQFTGRAASSAAGAVFLLHPLASAFTTRINLFYQVSAVSFYLGCFLCYLRCVRRRSGFLYAVALVLFGCGLLTSKVLLTLPALLFLVDVLYSRS